MSFDITDSAIWTKLMEGYRSGPPKINFTFVVI